MFICINFFLILEFESAIEKFPKSNELLLLYFQVNKYYLNYEFISITIYINLLGVAKQQWNQ